LIVREKFKSAGDISDKLEREIAKETARKRDAARIAALLESEFTAR